MNSSTLVGRLTKDPDLRYTSNGTATASFTLAVNRPFKNAEGNQEADFIQCVVWRKQAETLANYTKKGSQIAVRGRIQTRSYDNQQGQKVYVTEVVVEEFTFLDSKKDSQTQSKPNKQAADPFEKVSQPIDIGDDLPF